MRLYVPIFVMAVLAAGFAIFWLTRPATIIKSACRGVAENRSIPNRAMSKRGPAVAIISMAQQARPNVAGHSEPLRT